MKKILCCFLILTASFCVVGCNRKANVSSKLSGNCPTDMANVDGKFCVDRFEYPNKQNEYPIVNVDWSQATMLCKSEGKRLCSSDEWIYACQSAKGKKFPYGNSKNDSCNDSQDYKKDKREITYTTKQIQSLSDLLKQTDVTLYSEQNKKVIGATGYLLTLQLRFANAADAIDMAEDKEKALKNRNDIIKKLAFTPDDLSAITEEMSFLENEKRNGEKAVKIEKLSPGDYKTKLEALIDLEKSSLRTTGNVNSEQNKKLQALYANYRALIISAVGIDEPANLKKFCETNYEVLKDAIDKFSTYIYDEYLKNIPFNDVNQMNKDIVPAFEKLQPGIFSDYLYSLERKIMFEYDQSKAVFKFKRTQFRLGENEKCVTEQGGYDMVGNVWEWTGADANSANYRGGDSTEGSGSDFKRCTPVFSDVKAGQPDSRFPDVGFRCCK